MNDSSQMYLTYFNSNFKGFQIKHLQNANTVKFINFSLKIVTFERFFSVEPLLQHCLIYI